MLSACGPSTEDTSSDNAIDSNAAITSETDSSAVNVLTSAELITDENRGLIGTVITNTESAEAYLPGHNENTSQGEGENRTIPENTVINDAEETVLIPDTISVFVAENNTTPEVIMPNGSCAVFIPLEKTEGWFCQKGNMLHFSFEKYDSEVSAGQTMVVGVVYNGTMLEGETFTDAQDEYLYTASEQGNYAIYVISETSDYLSLKKGMVFVKEEPAEGEKESSVLDISESIDELLTPYQDVLDRLNRENGYKVYIPEDKKVSVYEAYKDMTPEEFEAEILRELEEKANGSYVLDDSDIMIGEHSDSPSDINDN